MARLLLILWTAVAAPQQSDPVIEWLTSLQTMQVQLRDGRASHEIEEIARETRQLHAEIAAWAATQPNGIAAPVSPEQTSPEALLVYVTGLRESLEQYERKKPGSPFYMGRIDVNVSAGAVQVPTAATLEQSDIRERDYRVVPNALNLVPGVSIQRIGPRNERGVYVRGFDIRQVPLYMDGIPVYVPYDGYVDLDRFLTYDLGEIQVAKGFTSPLYGPNAIGGAVNLISRKPTRKLNLDAGSGYGSGDERHGFLNVGSRWTKFWVQGGVEGLGSKTIPLSDKFQTVPLQPTLERANSYQKDYKGRVRFAWTPNENDEYSFTYANQQGQKGNPPYAGTDPAVRARFWQWPQWDKESFYIIGNKSLGSKSYVRFRSYYDKFNNLLKVFDNATYSTQNLASSFTSPFDDDTYGTSVEFGTRAVSRQTLKGSFYFKDDTHREGNLGEPERSFRDQTFSAGVEDTVQLVSRTTAVFGFSVDGINVLNAENFSGGQILPFPKSDVTSYNPQAGIFYAVSESGKFHFTFARKTRLPTMKDRYSYRMGQAIPNPDLREEKSNNWEAGYSQLLGSSTYIDVAFFLSDISNSTQRFFLQPNLFQFRNIGESRNMGGEFAVRSTPVKSLTFLANYTYLSRKNESNPTLIPVDTPRHKVYSSATYRFLKRFTALADLTYEANRWTQNDASRYLRVSPFAVVGISGTADFYRGVELQVGVNNLFDRNYAIIDGYPEAGRAAYVNFRYRL